jgi:hypothetical protein
VNGTERNRAPVASNTAFAIAAGIAHAGDRVEFRAVVALWIIRPDPRSIDETIEYMPL